MEHHPKHGGISDFMMGITDFFDSWDDDFPWDDNET
jgi:hypothetical protein